MGGKKSVLFLSSRLTIASFSDSVAAALRGIPPTSVKTESYFQYKCSDLVFRLMILLAAVVSETESGASEREGEKKKKTSGCNYADIN